MAVVQGHIPQPDNFTTCGKLGIEINQYNCPIEVRRIKTEEKAKVVAAVWGAKFIRFLAALAVLHWDDLENRLNSLKSPRAKQL